MLAATILGSSCAFLGGSVINVALPAIQQGLQISVVGMQWIGSVFTLLLATLTLLAGSAGDRFGRRRLFAIGLVILALGSVAAGLAATGAQLIAARAVQGLGGALLVPNSLALLSAAFPRAERGRAIGIWSAFTALTGAGGPILGGLLVDTVSWRAGFFLIVPLALVALAIGILRTPDVRIGRQRAEIDWWGAALAAAGLTALVLGTIQLANRPVAIPALCAGVALLVAFFWREARVSSPMIPPHLFRSRTFLGANLMTLLLYFAVTGFFFVLPFDLVRVRGYSATATGAAYLPFALIMALLSSWAGGLADRFGARRPLVGGSLLAAIGLLCFALPSEGPFWTTVFPGMALLGLGMAIAVAPLTATVLAAVDESQAGVASGINNTIARVAALLAVAIVGLIALSVFQATLAPRLASLELSTAVRGAVGQGGGLGDVQLPASARDDERHAVQSAIAGALATSFRRVALVVAALAAGAGALAALLIDAAPARVPVEGAVRVDCGHLGSIVDVSARSEGCEECMRTGTRWVHLRLCLSCGYVGCCDASPQRHATAHFWTTSHPIVRSLEPGETWRWCYVDEVAV